MLAHLTRMPFVLTKAATLPGKWRFTKAKIRFGPRQSSRRELNRMLDYRLILN
jgi:hypothetical protein